MTDAIRVFDPGFQVTNASGVVQSGAVLRFYAAGTSNARTVYSDLGLSSSLGTSVTCNSSGRPAASGGAGAEVLIYTGTTPYKVTAETSAGVSLWSFDNVIGALDTSSFLTGSVTAETPVITKTADYTILTTDQGKVINGNSTGGSITLTLPSAVTAGDGWRVHIRHTGTANIVTVATVSSQTISGYNTSATTFVLNGLYQSIQLVSDGANWHIDGSASGDGSVLPYHIASGSIPNAAGLLNGSITTSVNAGALTISITNYDGSAPSTSSPVRAAFRSATAATGTATVRSLTSATTLVISSGSTFAATSGSALRLWVVLFDDGGTVRVGAINCLSSANNIYPLASWDIASSTAEGGGGGADSSHTFYTGTAVSSKPYQVIGYLTWEGGLATAGTWNVTPTRAQLFTSSTRLPGTAVQVARTSSSSVATGTTQMVSDDTIPQNTEGDEYMSQAITPTSAANMLTIRYTAQLAFNNTGSIISALFRDTTASSLTATVTFISSTNANSQHHASCRAKSETTSSTTFKMRAGSTGANTVTFNGSNTSRLFGGVIHSFIEVEEIMA